MEKTDLLLLGILMISLFSCNKSNPANEGPLNPPRSGWVIGNDTFKGRAFYSINLIENSLLASTKNDAGGYADGEFVQVIFDYSLGKPSVSKTYTISTNSVPISTECVIHVGSIHCCARYFSNNPRESVLVSVSATGKLTATFSNIRISDGMDSTKMISGTLIEE